MSLERALKRLGLDAHSEHVLKDVLTLFAHHSGEWLAVEDVAWRTGRSVDEVSMLLPVLHESFVLDFDDAKGAYRYMGDIALDYEIEAFQRHVDNHYEHVASNVARFRRRHGI